MPKGTVVLWLKDAEWLGVLDDLEDLDHDISRELTLRIHLLSHKKSLNLNHLRYMA